MRSSLKQSLELQQAEIDIILRYHPKGICAFDLEMTGLSPLFDKIIEIAAIKINPDGSTENFYSLVNPLIEIPEHTIQYHGLNDEDLTDQPTLKKPLKEFSKFYDNLPLLAHNALYDASFLVRGHHEYNFNLSLSDVIDSCRFARVLYKHFLIKPDNYKLSTLAKYFEFDFTHHQAMDDAIVCLKIYAQCLIIYTDKKVSQKLKEMSFLFKLTSFKRSEEYILPSKLKDLKEYVQKQTPIDLKYKGGSMKGQFRPVTPISLLPLPQGLVLYALCKKSDLNKYFLISKVKEIKKTVQPLNFA